MSNGSLILDMIELRGEVCFDGGAGRVAGDSWCVLLHCCSTVLLLTEQPAALRARAACNERCI